MDQSKDEAAAKAAADKAKQDLDAAAKAQQQQGEKPKEEAPAPDKDKKTVDDPKAKPEDPAANNKPDEKQKTSIKDSIKVESPGFEWVEQALQGGKEAADGLKSLGRKISNTIGETKTAQAIKGTGTYQALKSGINAIKDGYQSVKDKISGLAGDAVSGLDTAVSKLFTKKEQNPTASTKSTQQTPTDPKTSSPQTPVAPTAQQPTTPNVTKTNNQPQKPNHAPPPPPTNVAPATGPAQEPAKAEPVSSGLGAPKDGETTVPTVAPRETTATVDSTPEGPAPHQAGQEPPASTDQADDGSKLSH